MSGDEKEKSTEDMVKDAKEESEEKLKNDVSKDTNFDKEEGDSKVDKPTNDENLKKKKGKSEESENEIVDEEEAEEEDEDVDEKDEKSKKKTEENGNKKKTESTIKSANNGTAESGDEEKEEDEDEEDKKSEDLKEEDLVSLGEISRINENINKNRVENLQLLYEICFDAPGKFNVVKKNLRTFAGFEFEPDSSEHKNKLEFVQKHDLKTLKSICNILALEKKGTKKEVSQRICKFLFSPEERDIPEEEEEDAEEEEDEEEEEEVPIEEETNKRKRPTEKMGRGGRPRRATAGKSSRDVATYVEYSSSDEEAKVAKSKRQRRKDDSDSGSDYNPSGGSGSEGARKRAKAARGPKPSKSNRPSWKFVGQDARTSDSEEDEEESEISEEDSEEEPRKKRAPPRARGRVSARSRGGRKRNETESEEEESEVENESEEEQPKKKRGKPAKNNKSPAGRGRAKPPPRKKARKASSEEEEEEEEKSDSEDEPLNKKGKNSFPTDDEIKSYVKEILDEANLEEITMKTVCKQVYAKYPDFDLTDKKDFIKATVKSLIAA